MLPTQCNPLIFRFRRIPFGESRIHLAPALPAARRRPRENSRGSSREHSYGRLSPRGGTAIGSKPRVVPRTDAARSAGSSIKSFDNSVHSIHSRSIPTGIINNPGRLCAQVCVTSWGHLGEGASFNNLTKNKFNKLGHLVIISLKMAIKVRRMMFAATAMGIALATINHRSHHAFFVIRSAPPRKARKTASTCGFHCTFPPR